MSFITEVTKKKLELNRPPMCKLGDIMSRMDDEDSEALAFALEWVSEGKASQAWLVKTLNDNGYPVGKTVVREHLREECACVTSS